MKARQEGHDRRSWCLLAIEELRRLGMQDAELAGLVGQLRSVDLKALTVLLQGLERTPGES